MTRRDLPWSERCRNASLLLLAAGLLLPLVGLALKGAAAPGAPASEQGALPQRVSAGYAPADRAFVDSAVANPASVGHAFAKDLLAEDADQLPFELFSLFSGFSAYEQGALPEGFASEVVDPGDFGCLQPTWSNGIVGMVCPGSMQEVLAKMSADLEGHGWSLASAGDQRGCLSFVKGSGEYRWLFVSGSEVAGSSSIWMVFSKEGS